VRNAFIDTILDKTLERDDLFIISGDAGLGVFDDFKEKRPDRFLNLGVAEQNAASFSAGLALTGYKVFLYNIAPFVLYRCYEQIRNDICYQDLPVVLVGIGSGVTYAPQGMTHYSVEDLGIAATLPNLVVISPIDLVEARAAALYALEADKPVYVRLAKRGEPRIRTEEKVDITVPFLLKGGKECAIIVHGPIAIEAVKAREMLEQDGISPALISLPMVQPMNTGKLFRMLKNMRYVFTVEEHFVNTGMGSVLAREAVKTPQAWRLFSLGITDNFIHDIKDTQGMRKHFGISARKIADFVRDIVKKG